MAELVVHLLEVVEIREHDRERGGELARPLDLRIERLDEAAPIEATSSPPAKIWPPSAPVASVITSRITGKSTRGLCVAASASPTSASASRGSPCAADGRRRSLLRRADGVPRPRRLHARSRRVATVAATASARNVQRTVPTRVITVHPAAPKAGGWRLAVALPD